MNIRVNYFDLGLFDGEEINMFLTDINNFDVETYVYGFEANTELYKKVKNRFSNKSKVKIYNLAISDKNGKTKLYLERSGEGSSIFKSKNNVDPNKFITVDSISFVDWVEKNVPDYKSHINILRFNIEGAELHLINDIVNKGVREYFNLFLGSLVGADIKKCISIKNEVAHYRKMLKDNDINILLYCKDLISHPKHRNINLKKEFENELKKLNKEDLN